MDLLICAKCGATFHYLCNDPPLNKAFVIIKTLIIICNLDKIW